MKCPKENNEYYEKIKSNKIDVFENINNKNDLFDLFVILNYEVFKKSYFDTTFSNFLKNNEELIKKYFGDNSIYNDILEKIDYKEISKKKEDLLNIIKKDINSDKLLIIIDSFYYILFYKFKDIKEIKGRTNIGNVYINTILTKFTNFLAENFDDINKNLIESLYELYTFDLKDAKYKENQKIEKEYYFYDIEKLLSTCGVNLKAKLELDKREYNDSIKKCIEIFDSLSYKVNDNFQIFYLKGLDNKITSNTITLIVDILSREDDEKDWTKFLKYFEKKTNFFIFKWSYYNKKNFLEKEKNKAIDNSKNLAKINGALLTDILISNKVFNNYQINLVGFSLGANVIKHCIKELSSLNGKKNYAKIKNVILIGAATHFKHEDKWKEYIKNNVIDRFINCYSGSDEKLKSIYSKISKTNKTKKLPIGLNPLELKDEKGVQLVENFDFTNEKYSQVSYDFENVAQKVFPNNKAL